MLLPKENSPLQKLRELSRQKPTYRLHSPRRLPRQKKYLPRVRVLTPETPNPKIFSKK